MDEIVLHLFNGFATRSWAFDTFMSMAVKNDLLRGGIMVALIMAVWYLGSNAATIEDNRKKMIVSFIGVTLALMVARLLVMELPFKPRPVNNPVLNFIVPYGINPKLFSGESSFPSDHAALFFALTTAIFLVSRWMGALALIVAVVVVSLPRIYLGLHYPTDIIAGAALGVVTVLGINLIMFRSRLPTLIYDWVNRHYPIFFPLFFLFNLEIATTFDDVRMIIQFIQEIVSH